MKKLILSGIILTTLYACTDGEFDIQRTFRIINNSDHDVILKVYNKTKGILKIPIKSHDSIEKTEPDVVLFHYGDESVHFIFEDNKKLSFYYDSIEKQTIHNPYNAFEYININRYLLKYPLTNEDYNRAK